MKQLIHLLLFGHAITNCLISIVAAFSFFKRNQNPEKAMWIVKAGALVSLTLIVLIGFTSNESGTLLLLHLLGETFVAGSTLIFFWSIRTTKRLSEVYSTDLPEFLTTQGPYRFVRNPFYLSYLMNYFGVAIGAASKVLAIQTFVMSCLYYKAAKFEEEKFKRSELSNDYEAYKKKTGMFFPKLLP